MDDDPLWLAFEDVEAIHEDQLIRHGGLPGYKDIGLVESAIVAPQNLFFYENEDDVLALAVHLCFAIAKNHGYNDGNKRTAAFAMIEFLAINGYDLFIPDDDLDYPLLGQWVQKLAAGDYDEARLYDRLEHFVEPTA